ncbi:MAG: hypothetical protein K8F58_12610 [Bauldia sp.]|nr:hypothetical protein [Bauldia sp.]
MTGVGRYLAFAAVVFAGQALTGAPISAQEVLSAEGETPDVRIEVRELKRGDGGTVTLRLRLVNESGDTFDAACSMREPGKNDDCGTFSGAYILDAANKKKYLVVRDADGKCVCSGVDNIDDGKKMNIWATYPAPPPEVRKVTVIVPLFEPIEGVPIAGP